MAQLELRRGDWQEAFDHLAEAYQLNLKLGRLDGICFVGWDLGRLLCRAGEVPQGMAILERSRAGFAQLGRSDLVEVVESLMNQFRAERDPVKEP